MLFSEASAAMPAFEFIWRPRPRTKKAPAQIKKGMRESHYIASSPERISVLRTNVKSARRLIISRAPVHVNGTSPQNRFAGSTYAFIWQGSGKVKCLHRCAFAWISMLFRSLAVAPFLHFLLPCMLFARSESPVPPSGPHECIDPGEAQCGPTNGKRILETRPVRQAYR